MRKVWVVLSVLLLISPLAWSSDSQSCLGCHDFGPESPVHPMLEGQHGSAEQGCASCHGASVEHSQRPTMRSPDVSFGPRWGSSVGDQDAPCLDCHQQDVAKHWQDSLHMSNQMTCVTCHDLHSEQDKVLAAGGQLAVCSICHKPQQHGIHAISEKLDENPDCTTCHNPHADQVPLGVMLANRSAGCRTCHDLVQMSAEGQSTAKARSYHKVMAQPDRTCLDCHSGIAHGPADAVAPFVPLAVASKTVTLFNPGQSDIDWILSEHPGAQPFRQGSNCQQCHRGDEAAMGESMGAKAPTSRDLEVSISTEGPDLVMQVSWTGGSDDSSLALMWGDGGNNAFRRGGCWAACHSDMPGMSRDRGQALGKYLADSRQQVKRIGQPALVKDKAALETMLAAGNFVEMWRVEIAAGDTAQANTATLQADLTWSDDSPLQATASFKAGRWQMLLRRPLQAGASHKAFSATGSYTFGMALHGKQHQGGSHWVSLPMTLSLDGEDTDFRAD
ncbi:hypothetical protein EYC98_16815 [Halieaceae bacterium IMCC14734]|uniref:NapC/NirT cytochrome c N-terminal domain-containing protein n=1 Tax=Candidatus Litorirhabdus singularis TaxID=2518993 RepID=A0ABT3TJP4_9GAMM|nr:NapC/NirT family cytochrome c [Candidatus Litorirhabdus singularis]MCX2982526.1 hypothetical protein [Candidatus Litorirhabdus singularis]